MSIELNGETRIFYIVGDPIAQVKSPSLLTKSLNARGENAIVIPAHIAANDLLSFVESAKLMKNLDGVVFTIPHKFAGLELCDESSERARYAGSANVMFRQKNGLWWGDNTDGQGYMDGIQAQGFNVKNKAALLVGAGGAGSAIAFEILERGASLLKIYDQNDKRLSRLVETLKEKFGDKVFAGDSDPEGVDLVANATPVGMKSGDPSPIIIEKLNKNQFVADVITKPEISPLVAYARDIGCNSMPGSGMFNAQAEILVDILLGVKLST